MSVEETLKLAPGPEHLLTYGERLALKILAEPFGLGTMRLIANDGKRCFFGVVADVYAVPGTNLPAFRDPGAGSKLLEIYLPHYGTGAVDDNDQFVGTPEERQRYMADRVRVLKDD